VSFLLAVVGALLFLLSLAGVVLGSLMVIDRRTREPGLYFALWWVPAVASGVGIFMEDPVTFTIGAFCFVVAGAAFVLERRGSRRPPSKRKRPGVAKAYPSYEEEVADASEERKPGSNAETSSDATSSSKQGT
jgi:hypothetical protein